MRCKIKLQFNQEIASNDFIAIGLSEKQTPQDQADAIQLPLLELRVSFDWHATKYAKIGLQRTRIQGRFESCSAKCIDKGDSIQELKKSIKGREVQEAEKTNSGNFKLSNSNAEGGLGSQNKSATTNELEETSEMSVAHRTFYWNSEGKAPRWIFASEKGQDFLEGSREITIGIAITAPPLSPSGIITASDLSELRILDSNGRRLSWYKELVIRHLMKQFLQHDLKAAFEITD